MVVYFICANIENGRRGDIRSDKFFLLSEAKRWIRERWKCGLISEYSHQGDRLATYYVDDELCVPTNDFK